MPRCKAKDRSCDVVWVYLHEFLLGALGADDVLAVGDEALAHQARLALRADEAVVVPVAVLEGDEAGAADAWNVYKLFKKKHVIVYFIYISNV